MQKYILTTMIPKVLQVALIRRIIYLGYICGRFKLLILMTVLTTTNYIVARAKCDYIDIYLTNKLSTCISIFTPYEA